MDDLLGDFLDETREHLQALDNYLIAFENNPANTQTLHAMFRLLHTIKGTSGFFGLPQMEKLAHGGETILAQFRDGVLLPTDQAINTVLQAVDALKALVDILEVSNGQEPDDYGQAVIYALDDCVKNPSGYCVVTHLVHPDATTVETDHLRTVRVPIQTLEDMKRSITALEHAHKNLGDLIAKNADAETTRALAALIQLSAELQGTLDKTRLQPIGSMWKAMPRLVRDTAKAEGKQVQLKTIGEDAEFDRDIVDLIKDPLVHIIRNAIGHGIERPGTRRAADKPSQATVTLSAEINHRTTTVSVTDDGRGLNTQVIKDKAIDLGLVAADTAEKLTEDQIHNFIFAPGFTTADSITRISGRGVGMDVVRTQIEKIGGHIQVTSTPGQGTCFSIIIPAAISQNGYEQDPQIPQENQSRA